MITKKESKETSHEHTCNDGNMKNDKKIHLNPRSKVLDHMKEAFNRIDGIAMYFCVVIFLITSIVFSIKNLLNNANSDGEWKIVIASLCMVPTIIVVYFNFYIMSTGNEKIGRVVDSFILLGIAIYFFYIFSSK